MLKKEFSKKKDTCKVTFRLPKEAVHPGQKVELVGDWNDWSQTEAIELKLHGDSYEAILKLPTGRNYEFRYWIDKTKWENDWSADAYVPNPFGFDNSVVSVVNVPFQQGGVSEKSEAGTVDAMVEGASEVAGAIAEVISPTAKKTTAKKTATKKTTASKTTTKKATTTRKSTTKATASKATTKTTRAKKDDFKKIEGIGPKIAGLLNEAGIITFEDLGKATQKVLKQVLADAGPRFKMHTPATWPKQAKLAAKGDWDKLKTLQDELKGGRA